MNSIRLRWATLCWSVPILLSGCGTLPHWPGTPGTSPSVGVDRVVQPQHQLMAVDMANVLMQIDSMHPSRTVISMKVASDSFSVGLWRALNDVGYRVESDYATPGAQRLQWLSIPGEQTAVGQQQTLWLKVGAVQLKRGYWIEGTRVRPSSNLFVQGTDPSPIVLNDLLFAETGTVTDRSQWTTPAIVSGQAGDERAPTIDSVEASASAVATVPRDPRQQNVYLLGHSNYSALTDPLRDVRQQVLIFPNDSLRLGSRNKQTIQQFVDAFNESSDYLSVIGCSHGRTSLNNGNAVLANGRAARVKEALLIAGIPEARILDEGCWAAQYFDEMMPRRGVVLTLKR